MAPKPGNGNALKLAALTNDDDLHVVFILRCLGLD